jgi:hypothetical protein
VKLNPLAVLVAILLAVELAGILGALLAIPVAGIIQVVVRDVWTIGAADPSSGRPSARTGHQWTPGPSPSRNTRPTPALQHPHDLDQRRRGLSPQPRQQPQTVTVGAAERADDLGRSLSRRAQACGSG